MVSYLAWLANVLEARAIPSEHLGLSLDWLAEFFISRMSENEGKIVAAALYAARVGFEQRDAIPLASPKAADPWPDAAKFEKALLHGDHQQTIDLVTHHMDEGHNIADIERYIIQPSLYEIGEKWQANKISVAQEHLATAIAQSVMTLGLLRSTPPAPNGKKALLGCVEGNHHVVGLRMVADSLILAGWETQYLGANVPTAAIVQQALAWRPDLVGLSVSFPHQLRVVRSVIEQMTAKFGDARPAVIIGGLAINRFNQIADALGADATCSDAHSAVKWAKSLPSNATQ